jgi:type II secretory pathway component PulF
MRFYQYTARDSKNLDVGGTMQASTEEEARQSLAKFGLQVLSVQELSTPRQAPQVGPIIQPPAPRPPAQRPTAAIPPKAALQASPYNYNQPQPVLNTPVTNSLPVVRTAPGTDKQRFFLFSQLASAFRAGINPSQAFQQVAQRSAGQFRPSLDEASAATAEGKTISQVFERYPDLYPDHVVGLIRAGEAAGFLPEAMDEVARQAESAHSFGRFFFWVWFLAVNFLLSVPATWIMTRGLVGMVDDMNRTGGAGGPNAGVQSFGQEMWRSLLWPWGPITLVAYAGFWVFRRYYLSSFAKDLRHKIGLKVPVYGKRARHENLARFAWTMSRVGKAGIAPARAWQLAADSVPNLAFRDQLVDIGTQMRENTRLSDIIHRSPVFPDEYAPMIATAEYTGDMPTAMEHLAQVSGGEFVAAQNYAKMRSGCWMLLAFVVTSGITTIMFAWSWYHEVPQHVLGDDNPLQ